MKRIIHILLAALLLISTTGLPLVEHYCKTQLQHVSLFGLLGDCNHAERSVHATCTNKSCCAKPEPAKETQRDCCNDEAELLKLEEPCVVELPVNINFSAEYFNVTSLQLEQDFFANTQVLNYPKYHPPDYSNLPLNVLFQVFLI